MKKEPFKKFNRRIDKMMMKILLWWNKLDFDDRELILIKAYKEWHHKK